MNFIFMFVAVFLNLLVDLDLDEIFCCRNFNKRLYNDLTNHSFSYNYWTVTINNKNKMYVRRTSSVYN